MCTSTDSLSRPLVTTGHTNLKSMNWPKNYSKNSYTKVVLKQIDITPKIAVLTKMKRRIELLVWLLKARLCQRSVQLEKKKPSVTKLCE